MEEQDLFDQGIDTKDIEFEKLAVDYLQRHGYRIAKARNSAARESVRPFHYYVKREENKDPVAVLTIERAEDPKPPYLHIGCFPNMTEESVLKIAARLKAIFIDGADAAAVKG